MNREPYYMNDPNAPPSSYQQYVPYQESEIAEDHYKSIGYDEREKR